MTEQQKLREEWHVRSLNMANEVSDYSKVEMLIADWWLDKIHQALAEERERVVGLIEEIRGMREESNQALDYLQDRIEKGLLSSLDKLTDKE